MVKTRIRYDQGVDEDFLSERELNDFFETVVITGTNGRDDTELVTTFDSYFPSREIITAGSGIVIVTGTNFVEIALSGTLDHGTLTGLADDDHLQYHNDTRGDARYHTQTELGATSSGLAGAELIGYPTVSGFNVGSPIPVSPSVQDALSFFFSAGWILGGEISDNLDQTITVASGSGSIRTSDSPTADLVAFGWDIVSSIPISDNTSRFIGVSYNSVTNTATVLNKSSNTWDYTTEFPLGLVSSRDNVLDVISLPHTIGNLPGLINRRFEEVEGAVRASGMILSESGDTNQNVSVSAGVMWFKLNRFITASVDTSGSDTFDSFYSDGGSGWTKIADETAWDEFNYDDGSGLLAALNPNRFGNLWFYLESDGGISCVYGISNSNTIAVAETETAPADLPPGLSNSVLLGRIVFERGVTIALDVQSSFDTTFNLSSTTDHGNLSGLNDDDHLQYSLVDGTRAFTGTVGGITPVADADLTTKLFVTTVSGNLQSQIDSVEASPSEITSSGLVSPLITITTDTTLTPSEGFVLCDTTSASILVTLPTTSGESGRSFHIKKIDPSVNKVTVSGNNITELVEFSSTAVITVRGESISFINNGQDWFIF